MGLQEPRHAFQTYALSIDDDPATQAFCDFDIVCDAVRIAKTTQVRYQGEFFNSFPGEHYRLLAGLLTVLRPKKLIDIGTFTGMSARMMLDYGDANSKVTTYDIVPWNQIDQGTVLTSEDFGQGRIHQFVHDLATANLWETHRPYFEQAGFIMLDGPKNDFFETLMLQNMTSCHFQQPTFLLMDDIRFPNQLANWRRIQSPKIDLTSFGHFSGTGLVNITEGLKLDMGKGRQK